MGTNRDWFHLNKPIFDALHRLEKAEPELVNNFMYNKEFNAWPFVRLHMLQVFRAVERKVYPYMDYFMYNFGVYSQQYTVHENTKDALSKIPHGACVCMSRNAYHGLHLQGKVMDRVMDSVAIQAIQSGIFTIKLQLGEIEDNPRLIDTVHVPYDVGKNTLVPHREWKNLLPEFERYFEACMFNGVPPLHLGGLLQQCVTSKNVADAYTEIFRIIRPACVCLSNYYETKNHGIALACHRLGIPSIEVQHGLQLGHPAYTFGHIPPEGFEAFPKWWFQWGDYSKMQLDTYFKGQKKHQAVAVGYPFYDVWRQGKLPPDPVLVQKLQDFTKDKKVILVALAGVREWETVMLPELVRRSPEDWCWLIRKHPMRGQPDLQLDSQHLHKVEWEAASELNLFSVLEFTDHCVTGESTVPLEAIFLRNIQSTYLTDYAYNGNVEYFSSIQRLGLCLDVDSALARIQKCFDAGDIEDDSTSYISHSPEILGRMLKVICASGS